MDKPSSEKNDDLLTDGEYLAKYKFTRKEYEEAAFGKDYVDAKYSNEYLAKCTRQHVEEMKHCKEWVGDGVWIYLEK